MKSPAFMWGSEVTLWKKLLLDESTSNDFNGFISLQSSLTF